LSVTAGVIATERLGCNPEVIGTDRCTASLQIRPKAAINQGSGAINRNNFQIGDHLLKQLTVAHRQGALPDASSPSTITESRISDAAVAAS